MIIRWWKNWLDDNVWYEWTINFIITWQCHLNQYWWHNSVTHQLIWMSISVIQDASHIPLVCFLDRSTALVYLRVLVTTLIGWSIQFLFIFPITNISFFYFSINIINFLWLKYRIDICTPVFWENILGIN